MAVVLHHVGDIVLQLASISLKDVQLMLQLHVLGPSHFVLLSFQQHLPLDSCEFFYLGLSFLEGFLKCEIQILARLLVVGLESLLNFILFLVSGLGYI